ncbi:MAG: thiamine pyrophosphate-binding protein [Alphaproteobacteria bacterium]|nr:thiamine pyrophosphate-binding protein [Alphaproteobacteria bacterium]
MRKASEPEARSGGQVIADQLRLHGVRHVFCVPGESYLDLLDGLYGVRDAVQLITCRFEAGAVNMAEAYAKLTGKPGVAIVTRGPGAMHGAIGLHTAMQDSTPLVLLVGQIPRDEMDRESFQEIDYRRLFDATAKWVVQIDDARRIPELMHRAFVVAASGRPGPVVVVIPEDMQTDRVTVADGAPYTASLVQPYPDPAGMARLRALLAGASQPLVIVGGSGWSEQGRADIAAFAAANGLPVTVSFRRQGILPGTDPLFVGDLGVGSDPALVAKAREADLILAIGTRLGEPVTQGYGLMESPAPRTRLVHVHPDPSVIGRLFQPTLSIQADANNFAAAARAMKPVDGARWAAWARSLRELREAGRAPPNYGGALDLGRVMRELETMLAGDAIIASDAGNFYGWVSRFLNLKPGQRYVGPTNGAMGYGVPAAIGAKIADPARMVVCAVGDGGFMMTGQEIATAFHHGVNPILIVFNNNMYGTIRMHQERDYPGRISGTALTNPDFARFIESFGGHGEVVSRTDEFRPAFQRAVASGKPALIELRMDPDVINTRTTLSAIRAKAAAEKGLAPKPPKPAPRKRPVRAPAAKAKRPGAAKKPAPKG